MLLKQREGDGTTDFDAIKLLDKLLVGLFDDVEVLCKSRVELTEGDLRHVACRYDGREGHRSELVALVELVDSRDNLVTSGKEWPNSQVYTR